MRADVPDPHRHGAEIDTTDIRNPETVHEERDVNVRAILMFGLFLLVSAIIIHIALWGFFRFLENQRAKQDPRPSPVAGQRPTKFPQPQLQPNPVEDVARMRAREAEQLHKYGWVNKQAGVAHIPIERAMELVVQRGLPSRQAQPQAQGAPAGTESSGGEKPNQAESANPSSDAHGQREAQGKPATPATREKPRLQ